MIQYLVDEKLYIIHINGLYLESIKSKSIKLNSEQSKAKRFDNPDEAEFFYDMFTECHEHKPIEANPMIISQDYKK